MAYCYGVIIWKQQQKKAIRIITRNEYLSHSEPLFKSLGLLKLQDILSLKLFKFYYKLNYGELPEYFDNYLDIIHKKHPHEYCYDLRREVRPLIEQPKTRLVLTENGVIHKLIELLNVTNYEYPLILLKIVDKTHSFVGFNLYVKTILLNQYRNECNNSMCYTCNK